MRVIFEDLFQQYEKLVAKADESFREVEKECAPLMKCGEMCSDCCNSVFGLFLIESVYLNQHVAKMERRKRREVLSRGERSDRELLEAEKRLQMYDHDPGAKALAMARERVRCPLLGDQGKCVLYQYRPVTCRVYGIPTIINGKIHACWKAGFEKDRPYPAFNLDGAYRELYRLSGLLLQRLAPQNMERASLLVSVSKSISTPPEGLIYQNSEDRIQNPE